MGKIGQNPKIRQLWRPVALQPYVVQKCQPEMGNPMALGLQRGVNSISLQCILWPVACSEWGACLTDFDFQIFRFRHPDYDLDWAQMLVSLSMSRHLSTRKISSKSMHAFFSNLASRQTDRQTNIAAIAYTSSLSDVNERIKIGVMK